MEDANEECSEGILTANASVSDTNEAKNDDRSKTMVDATASHRRLTSPASDNNNNNNNPTTTTAAAIALSATLPAIESIVGNDDNIITSEVGADTNEKLFIDDGGTSSTAVMPLSDQQPASSSFPSTHQTSSLSSQNPPPLPPPQQQQQQHQQQQLLHSRQPPGVDESKIQKAISFLQNPTIRDVSNNNKRIYLEQKTDLNMWEIDAAMNRIMKRNATAAGGGVDGNVNGNLKDCGGNDVTTGEYVSRGHHTHEQLQEEQHQNPSDHYNTHPHHHQQQQRRGHPPSPLRREDGNYYNDYNNSARQRFPPPPSPPSQPSLPQYQDDNEHNHWQRREGQHDPHYYDNGSNHHTDYRHHYRGWEGDGGEVITAAVEEEGGGGGGGSTSSWIGGFSIGIFGLAAWRWLNGGDFILFPPPSIVSSATTASSSSSLTTLMRNSLNNGDGTKSDPVAQQVEEETMKTVSWKDLPSCPEESGGQDDEDDCKDEDQEEDTVEEESDEGNNNDDDDDDDEDETIDSYGLHAILNRKNTLSRNHSQPPNTSFQHQPPSYEELVLEIRALTSAINSHRDSQERIARNAYNTNVGKGLTDDAMDFLRKKKKKEEENNNSNDNNSGDLLRENLSVVVAPLLKEVSDDLIKLKHNMNSEFCEDGNQERIATIGGAMEESSEKGENEEETVLEVEGPTEHIDVIIEKVQKVLAIVDKKPNGDERGNFAALEDGDVGGINGKMGDENDENKRLFTVAGVDSMSAHVEQTQSDVLEEVATKADEPEVHESEERHHDYSLPTPEKFQINDVVPQQHDKQQQHQQQQQLEDALRTLANSNDAQKLKVGAQMLYLYCRNISQNASVPRYRKIYTNNNTFRNKVGDLVGAKDFLVAVGFVERAKENLFEWSDHVGEGVTEATIKSKLDFALIALELMKNGERGDYFNGCDLKDAK